MGIDVALSFSHKFIYKAALDNNLIEHELDYVFTGKFDGTPAPDPVEVKDWKFIGIADIEIEVEKKPEAFTHWFKIILKEWEKVSQ